MGGVPRENLAGIYLLKVNNRNTRINCEICSKLTVKTQEQPHWHRSGVFIANFEHILHCSSVYIVNLEHVFPSCKDVSKIWKHKGRWVIYK